MAQPEAKLSRQIMSTLRAHGAFVFKVWGNEKMMAGIPDIVGVYQGRFIAVETKMPGGTVSAIQQHRHEQLRAAGAVVVVAYSVQDALNVLKPPTP